jgi:hypothetical protein
MKALLKPVIFFLITIITLSCFSKKALIVPNTLVLPLGDTVHLKDGSLVYGLPITVFNVQIEMERTIEKPGPYSRYAGDLVGIRDAIMQESESWTIKGIKIQTYEELDPSEFYVIESNTLVETNALTLKKTGLILDLNPDIYKNTDNKIVSKEINTDQIGFTDLGVDEYYISQKDTAYRLVKMDTTFIKIPYLVEKKKQLSLDQLAEKAAKRLLELREGMHMILTGEATVFPQDKAAINEINRLDGEYTALFAGKIWKESKIFTYTLIPQKEMTGKQVTLLRFSELTGPANISEKGGKPVVIEFTPAKKTKELTLVTKQRPEAPDTQRFDKLYYRVPDIVNVKINMGAEALYNNRKLIYQFGEVIQLPANYIIGK